MRKFLLTWSALAIVLCVWAQERTVSGRVTSADDGSALPGVNVVVRGTSNGTVTDTEGNYKLTLSPGDQILVFSFIGLETLEAPIGEKTSLDIQLRQDVQQLTEVVVTAQGIERERKALGYASTSIDASDIANKPETDVGRALQGRTPGLQILSSSGMAGSGSKVNIRGISSVSGNTQPLWVVDGVPINTSTNDSNTDFRDGQIAPSRFIDIDPNNIESVNVLRGLSATTLYGSLGRNGVILVTTKTGSSNKQMKKFEASLSHSYFMIEAILPEFQNKWANGFDGDYGEFFSNWGSLFSRNTPVGRHPFFEHRDLFPEHPEFADEAGYIPKAYPDNVNDFFNRGSSSNTSVNLGMRSDNASVNFNYSHLDETGYIENNNLTRDNLSLGGTANLTKKFSLMSTFNFVRTDIKTPPTGAGTGSNSTGGPSVFANLFYTPRNLDLMNWPYENPVTHASVFFRNDNSITNPRWLLYNSQQTSETNRFFTNVSLNYQLLDWLKVTYRLGLDTYTEKQGYWVNKGSVGYPTEAALLSTGLYRTVSFVNTIVDHSAIASINKELTPDLDLTGIIGFNSRTDTNEQSGLESSGQVVFGLVEHRNFLQTTARDFRGNNLNAEERRAWLGAYFDAGIGYKNFLYLNVTRRNDWSTTLESANRSLFYPGASVSFIPTAIFSDFAPEFLDFLKVRVAYGTSANFPDPYNTRSYLTVVSQASEDFLSPVSTLSTPTVLVNKDLKPELLTETEVGLELQLLENRVKLDLSRYWRKAEDQILSRSLDPSAGYLTTLINAGSITNKGWEVGLTLVPLQTEALTWNLRTNFTRNVSRVESLPEGSKEILISGFTDLGNFAVEGEPFNVIKSNFTERTESGEYLIDEEGNWVISNDIKVIGDPNPKWLASVISSLDYKGLTFGFQWDYVYGGDVYSYTAATMVGRGVAKDLESFNPGLPLILPGVKESDGQPNDIPVTTSGMFFGNSIIGGSANDRGIFDATRIRLREVSLGYNIPKSITSRLYVNSINISLVGNNLWFRAINAPKYSKADFDRTAFGVGNGAGFDFLGGPSARRYGINLRITL